MNRKKLLRSLTPAMAVAAFLLTAWPSSAVTFNLRACVASVTAGGSTVAIWGYDTGALGAACAATIPGPMLTIPPNDTSLTISLTNNLPIGVATSLVIPGFTAALAPVRFADLQGRQRVRSFTTETAPGATGVYNWTGLKPGTYLYHSGTHPALQVQMGLYGAVKMDAGATLVAYPGVPYAREIVLLYSEIDPALRPRVAAANYTTLGVANYKPTLFLINGKSYPEAQSPPLPGLNVNENVLIRFINAGLKAHVPTLSGGYLNLVAEDGNVYPYPKKQYSVNLPALKTVDALWVPTAAGQYPLYDRSLHLTANGGSLGAGMLTILSVGGAVTAPIAVDDAYVAGQGKTLSVAAPGVLANDTYTAGISVAVTAPTNGLLLFGPDGAFAYTPNAGFAGSDSFTYQIVNVPPSNIATVRITVQPNSAPTAVNDSATTASATPITINVLANDTDPQTDPLTVANLSAVSPAGAGAVTLNLGGTAVIFTPSVGFSGQASFTYTAFDGLLASNVATVTVLVGNQAPVAVNDNATTPQNVPVVINLAANDYDPDGAIIPATLVIVDNPNQGGTVVNNLNGTVLFTPRRNFRGTDLFTYTVRDNLNAVSNKATVRVDVVR